MSVLNVRIPYELKKKIKQYANLHHTTMTDIVTLAIKDHMSGDRDASTNRKIDALTAKIDFLVKQETADTPRAPKIPRDIPMYQSKDWLNFLYHVERRSIRDISNVLDCPKHIIIKWMDIHVIERRSASECMRGELHPNWKGGETPFSQKVRALREYRKWREAVIDDQGDVCIECGSNERVEIDHIKPFAEILNENEITTLHEARQCSALWDISNGRPLCRSCHEKTDTYAGRVSWAI